MTQLPTPPLTDPSVGRGRRMLWPAVAAAGAAGFALVAHVLNPYEGGNYPTCPWLALTGTYCPGCGTLRATHSLTEGNVVEALQRNPLTVAAFVLMTLGFIRWARRQWRGEQRMTAAPAWLLYGLFWVIMAFWIGRNIPGWTWLSPV
ncbi:hypothetical protein N802_13545 [Knoellia sinensis KCTC 19936]|uniref:DUF2752 domain-containing protein n=1 Tax=Knoellia sinensis KCTC 19936 TaxID=1385520 RepID=A0A0A0JFH9_9MICO|nr:DUF2752 domain-containing protein [Knoellia sinensis]KGN34361.1 hypothetical protein N802_13545 [Knoellia sinensis KCTC 19936]